MNTNPRCITCKFFEQQNDEQGLCNRYPPTVFVVGAGKTASISTTVRVENWCGEHVKQLILPLAKFPKFNIPKEETPPQ